MGAHGGAEPPFTTLCRSLHFHHKSLKEFNVKRQPMLFLHCGSVGAAESRNYLRGCCCKLISVQQQPCRRNRSHDPSAQVPQSYLKNKTLVFTVMCFQKEHVKNEKLHLVKEKRQEANISLKRAKMKSRPINKSIVPAGDVRMKYMSVQSLSDALRKNKQGAADPPYCHCQLQH